VGYLETSNDLDKAFDEAEVSQTNYPRRLPAGDYVGVVTKVNLGESTKPWVDTALHVELTTNDGATAEHEVEVAPLTGKDGEISPGKIKFLKWQLQALGYEGKYSDLEYELDALYGRYVDFQVKTSEGSKTNPHTGKPYINREVVLKNPAEGFPNGATNEQEDAGGYLDVY
jgi:hypothetical protein